ncbi:MAG: TRIC cation channel family protein [Gordonibacter sp.]|nr:TRIC cation channel family protein [Gordonibacter sp.]
MDIAGFIDSIFTEGQVLTVPWGIDYFSVVVGVLTGALFACDRKLDIIGTVVLGLLTGYGGGIIRDTLMQGSGVYFTAHPDLVVICIIICVFVFYFRGLFKHLDATVFFADALSVGLFALAGASKAFTFGEGFVLSVILGAVTAVGGGALRDICVGETPGIFRQSNFYAVAGLGGAFIFVVLAYTSCPLPLAGVACVFVVVLLRYWSVYFDWKTRPEADLTPHVARGFGSVGRLVSGVFLQGGARMAKRKRRKDKR